MIQLRTNRELQQTFERLIKVMKVPVKWNGIFAVVDNYIILQGELRSLFFHFDSRRVTTNIIDIPVNEENVKSIEGNPYVCNSINMILYVFGKWKSISGVRVEKNYPQLNALFSQILKEMKIEPEYTKDYFRFYKDNMRITYEDVIQAALEAGERPIDSSVEGAQGLWHKLIWKRAQTQFGHVSTTWSERRRDRLGNNFYLVGHLCPVCKKKMHMAVYPMDKEFRIETEEGGVIIARTATCSHCNSFYTPRPKKILSEGDVYTMQFGDDRKAYEDYLELLGKKGDRVSNCRFNEYADGHQPESETEVSLEEFCENLSEYSEEEIERVQELMEQGFYPDESIRRLERKIKDQIKKNQKQKKKGYDGRQEETSNMTFAGKSGQKPGAAGESEQEEEYGTGQDDMQAASDGTGGNRAGSQAGADRPAQGAAEKKEHGAKPGKMSREEAQREKLYEKYVARAKVSDRFSERQLKQFRDELSAEKGLDSGRKKEILEQVDQKILDKRVERLTEKVDTCEGKPYAVVKRVYDEVEQEEIPQERKEPLLTRLRKWLTERGTMEVRQLMVNMPARLNRESYQKFERKVRAYEGVDLSMYEEKLQKSREQAEAQELEEMVRRARKTSREDYKDLSTRLREGGFLPELVLPYQEKVDEKLRELEKKAIEEICPNPMDMSFEEGMEAYEKLQEGDFLPELKIDALEALTRRLSKIKTDECELLVSKLKSELKEAGVAENEKHYFYPAKRVLLEQAEPEETAVIDYAVASYAAGRRPFEYPILVVDATKSGSGKEGIILTPEHLYYSNLFSSYGIPVDSISKISASTGLLNKGIYVHQKNGTKIKIPYAVASKELTKYAGAMDGFIHYLQEKPESRELGYLAKEKHETICCFRCGHVYQGSGTCPKCGYQNNG